MADTRSSDGGLGAMRWLTNNGTACAMVAKAADCALTGNMKVPEPVELTYIQTIPFL